MHKTICDSVSKSDDVVSLKYSEEHAVQIWDVTPCSLVAALQVGGRLSHPNRLASSV
jgi:hypothetical protein